jgi:hypothetical protein
MLKTDDKLRIYVGAMNRPTPAVFNETIELFINLNIIFSEAIFQKTIVTEKGHARTIIFHGDHTKSKLWIIVF